MTTRLAVEPGTEVREISGGDMYGPDLNVSRLYEIFQAYTVTVSPARGTLVRRRQKSESD